MKTQKLIRRRNSLLAVVLFCLLAPSALSAADVDSVTAPRFTLRSARSLQSAQTHSNSYLDSYLQYGFRIGTDINLGNKQISARDYMDGLFSGTFGFYARGGYEFIFGELGLNYMFYRGTYDVQVVDSVTIENEIVESRYLQIPISVVGYWQPTDHFALVPKVGIIYQPLLQVTENDAGYGKHNFTKHQCLLQAGIGIRYKFITFDVAYKKAFKPFFSDRTSLKQSFLHISVGVQF